MQSVKQTVGGAANYASRVPLPSSEGRSSGLGGMRDGSIGHKLDGSVDPGHGVPLLLLIAAP